MKAMKIIILCIALCSFCIVHPVFSSGYDMITSKAIWEPKEGTFDKKENLTGITQHTINLSAGEEFILSLDSNPTTGYGWELQGMSEEGIVVLTGSEYKKPEGSLMGQGGKEYWTFKAEKKGKSTITMVYRRPWEKETPPLRKAIITMIVH